MSLAIVIALIVSIQSGLTASGEEELKRGVANLYAEAGIGVKWIHTPVPGSLLVTVVRALPAFPGCESAFGCTVVDRTNAIPGVAYIAAETVWKHELANPLIRRRMMTYITAHEIGHLMGLPHGNQGGIMHRNIELLPHVQWTEAERSALAQILTPVRRLADLAIAGQ